ncbi:hypothetical protein [Campylobacter lari]|uniref:Uncharacterized protein n=1 Tax=Campylobacter lari TaxID=201 RepID=A0A5M0YXP9_CAMLA|nr:hypothetical protein [Campylobacter lari]EAK0445492.1 hypothetical protein [Campylobacter lari]EAK9856948.1 hypothetical protein [Campylobacter lari]ECW8954949.1 hypothetical protein [Campylobacter lari]MBT0824393.1 hypothetical protein [Campylobacter lari]MCR6538443.1 hypothetical protein [Campylobacter lari]
MRKLSLVAFGLLNSVFKAKTAHFNGFLAINSKNKPKQKKQRFKRKKRMSAKQKIRFKKRKI